MLALKAFGTPLGELKLSAEAHSFGELKLPLSQTMLISHCRRKHCSSAMAFTLSKLTHRCGFSSSQLGIECKHSLLSHAASVALLRASQA